LFWELWAKRLWQKANHHGAAIAKNLQLIGLVFGRKKIINISWGILGPFKK
jgi:hypothetical protein